MRPIVDYFPIFAVITAMGCIPFLSEAAADDPRMHSLQSKAEAQIERLKAARERAGARITLSKIKSSVQTRRAQEDLIRQVEILDRIRELMQERMTELMESSVPDNVEAAGQVRLALAQIEGQAAEARALIKQLELQIQSEEAAMTDEGNCYDPIKNPLGKPCGNGETVPSSKGNTEIAPDIQPSISLASPPPSSQPPATPPPLPTPG